MDPAIISQLQLSESEVARLLALGSNYITPDEARVLANSAADAHKKLFDYGEYLWWDRHFEDYANYMYEYHNYFLTGLKLTYDAAYLGSDYFASFKTQVSDKWQEDPWEPNKAFIANFLNDSRGGDLKHKNDHIVKYFDDMRIEMKNVQEKIDNPEIQEELGPFFNTMGECTNQVDGFGKSWNEFYHDAELIRDKTEIAVDSQTKTYLTERVQIIGGLSKTLSEAMGIYAQTLKDRGVLSWPYDDMGRLVKKRPTAAPLAN